MNKTSIPWADFTWNPTTGCTFGCPWCYARGVARRFGKGSGEGTLATAADFHPRCHPHRLDEPLRRKKPAVIFLGSMGDVFDPAIPDGFRDRIFATVAAAHWHTFIVLTKRAEAMLAYVDTGGYTALKVLNATGDALKPFTWPLPNLVLGVSVTNQADADERIPLLLDTPAARRMVSVEPMLGPVDLQWWLNVGKARWGADGEPRYIRADYLGHARLDFVAVGGKTPGKPLHAWRKWDDLGHDRVRSDDPNWPESVDAQPVTWLRALRDQCLAAGVPFHYKHGGTNPPLDGVVYDAQLKEATE